MNYINRNKTQQPDFFMNKYLSPYYRNRYSYSDDSKQAHALWTLQWRNRGGISTINTNY